MRCLRPVALLSLSLAAAGLACLAAPAAALDVVYVVRHTQKNPALHWGKLDALRPLSKKGAICAARLGKLLRNRGIAAVYTSEVTRTLATGAAVSTTRDGVEVVGDDATLKPSAEYVRELRRRHAEDQAILLVGHSNTVDDLVLAFRPDMKECLDRFRLAEPGTRATGIAETEYGNVWRLKVGAGESECRGVNRELLGRVGDIDCSTP